MKERTRTEYSMLNMLAGIGGYILNTILGFICRMVFVKYLSADYLGVNGLFTNILTMLSLAELGIGGAIVYALYKPLAEHDDKKIASLMKVYGTAYRYIGLAIGVVGLCLLPFLNVIITTKPNISESIYLLYLLNLFNTVITYFYSYKSSLLIAAQQNYIVVGINYTITILQSIFQMVALYLTRNYLCYLLIQTAGTFIYNISVSMFATKRFPCMQDKNIEPLPKEEKKLLFKNIKDLTYYKVSGLLVNSTDNILITFFKGLSITGIASNYTLLITTLNSLLGQVFNSLTASIGNHNALENKENIYKMFRFFNFMNFWIFGWATLGIVFCSTDIIRLFFGKQYVLNISIPIIMAANFFTVGMMNSVWTYKHTLGLFHYGRFLQIFTGILNIVMSIILGKYFGLFGILAATLVARLMTNLWYDPYAIFKFGFNKPLIEYIVQYLKYLLVLALAAIVCFFTMNSINIGSLSTILLKMIICSIDCNLVFYIFFRNTPEFDKFKNIFKNVLNIIRNKMKRGNING